MTHVDTAQDLRRRRGRETSEADGSEEINSGHLRAFVGRIELIREEQKALGEDLKEIYAEAKGNGFDPKIIRKIVAIRGQDPDKRSEEETLIELYLSSINRAEA